MDPREKYTIPSVRNGCRVLKYVANYPDGLDLKTISSQLRIPRTTALRICTTLELENLLLRTRDGKYILGSSLAPLGMRALPNTDLRKMAVPVLSDLVEATGETAHLAVLCGRESLILEVCDSPHQLRVASRPGSLAQIHCSATGKVFLAWSVFTPLEDFFKDAPLEQRTSNTLTSLDRLREALDLTRRKGYAIDNEEYHLGVRCIAVPVRNRRKQVVASLGITGATVRFTSDKIDSYAKILKTGADILSKGIVEE